MASYSVILSKGKQNFHSITLLAGGMSSWAPCSTKLREDQWTRRRSIIRVKKKESKIKEGKAEQEGRKRMREQRKAECRYGEADKLSNPAKKRGCTGTMISKFKFLKFFFNNYPLLTSENLLLFASFIIDKPWEELR